MRDIAINVNSIGDLMGYDYLFLTKYKLKITNLYRSVGDVIGIKPLNFQ